MSAPLNPFSHQRPDEPRARTIARNAVQGFNLFVGQSDLDADPAFLARPFSRDLRFSTFCHGSSLVAGPSAIKAGGANQTFVVVVARRTRDRAKASAALNHGVGMPIARGVLDRGVNCCSLCGPFSRLHNFLHRFNVLTIWGTHIARQWGAHIFFARAAA